MRFSAYKNQFGPRRSTYIQLARTKQAEAAWFYQIASVQGSSIYQRKAADAARQAMHYLLMAVWYPNTPPTDQSTISNANANDGVQ